MADDELTVANLRDKTDDELTDLVKTTKSDLFEARFQNYTNRLNDTAKIRKLRRQLARIHTLQTARHGAVQTKSEG